MGHTPLMELDRFERQHRLWHGPLSARAEFTGYSIYNQGIITGLMVLRPMYIYLAYYPLIMMYSMGRISKEDILFKNTDAKSQNSRLDELFDWTGIGNRYYEDNGMKLLSKAIDYEKVNDVVDKKRKECQEILRKGIS